MENIEWVIRIMIALVFAYFLITDILEGGDFSREP